MNKTSFPTTELQDQINIHYLSWQLKGRFLAYMYTLKCKSDNYSSSIIMSKGEHDEVY